METRNGRQRRSFCIFLGLVVSEDASSSRFYEKLSPENRKTERQKWKKDTRERPRETPGGEMESWLFPDRLAAKSVSQQCVKTSIFSLYRNQEKTSGTNNTRKAKGEAEGVNVNKTPPLTVSPIMFLFGLQYLFWFQNIQNFMLITVDYFKNYENVKKMEKNAFEVDNLFSEFRPTRAAKQRPHALYAP